ncbi:MAG: hypothetical protein JW940_32820 [Polyangiaceae bacterium]|nr:hypothetical protein [Polyangiaceae bacterium]
MRSHGKLVWWFVGIGWLVSASPCAGKPATAQAPRGVRTELLGCDLRGSAPVVSDVVVYRTAQGRTPVARFTGAPSALWLTKVPAGSSRLGIQTGIGTGSFRIRGYIDAARAPVVSKARLEIATGHLWIAKGQTVRVLESGKDRFRVEKRLTDPIDQSFEAWATCEQLELGAGRPSTSQVPGSALSYVLEAANIDLYDDWRAGRRVLTSLHRSPRGSGLLLFSTQSTEHWVRVRYFGGIEIDAWAPAGDLVALPPGEIADGSPAAAVESNRTLKLAEWKRETRTHAEVPIRIEAREQAPVVGVIEPNTDTVVVHEVAGWSSVMPRSIHVAPYNDGVFWVRTSDLEKADRPLGGGAR